MKTRRRLETLLCTVLKRLSCHLHCRRAEGFRLATVRHRSPFNYGNAQKVLLEMVFKNRQTALILRETPFNRMQKLEERRDGTFKLTVEVADTVLLTGWIEAWREKAALFR